MSAAPHRVLGAILAGGKSSRFGGDKGAAQLDGRALIDHVADGLRPQVDALIICGREWPGLAYVADRPAPDMGPLGGLCAALQYGAEAGYTHVVSAGCDTLPVPHLSALLEGPAVIAGHYLFGCWPTQLAPMLDQFLAGGGSHSMRRWIVHSGARELFCDTPFYNLNTRDDFLLYSGKQGQAA
jgi:molybdenum cofactor guanylyltransferase